MSSYRYHGRLEQTSFAANGISAWSAIVPPRLVTRLSCAHSGSNGMIESQAFRVVPYGKSVSTMSTLSSGMLFITSRQSPLYSSIGQPPFFWRFGAACRARTCTRPVMSRMLWPTELKRHKKNQLCCMELLMQKAGFLIVLYQQRLIRTDSRPCSLDTATASDLCPRLAFCVVCTETETPRIAHKVAFFVADR